jgi:hypothetical protein
MTVPYFGAVEARTIIGAPLFGSVVDRGGSKRVAWYCLASVPLVGRLTALRAGRSAND